MPALYFGQSQRRQLYGGYYLATASKVMDAALALAVPAKTPSDRRRNFKVIQGGRA